MKIPINAEDVRKMTLEEIDAVFDSGLYISCFIKEELEIAKTELSKVQNTKIINSVVIPDNYIEIVKKNIQNTTKNINLMDTDFLELIDSSAIDNTHWFYCQNKLKYCGYQVEDELIDLLGKIVKKPEGDQHRYFIVDYNVVLITPSYINPIVEGEVIRDHSIEKTYKDKLIPLPIVCYEYQFIRLLFNNLIIIPELKIGRSDYESFIRFMLHANFYNCEMEAHINNILIYEEEYNALPKCKWGKKFRDFSNGRKFAQWYEQLLDSKEEILTPSTESEEEEEYEDPDY